MTTTAASGILFTTPSIVFSPYVGGLKPRSQRKRGRGERSLFITHHMYGSVNESADVRRELGLRPMRRGHHATAVPAVRRSSGVLQRLPARPTGKPSVRRRHEPRSSPDVPGGRELRPVRNAHNATPVSTFHGPAHLLLRLQQVASRQLLRLTLGASKNKTPPTVVAEFCFLKTPLIFPLFLPTMIGHLRICRDKGKKRRS